MHNERMHQTLSFAGSRGCLRLKGYVIVHNAYNY